MAKEEPGRLLSKVAKFVRNPLKDWSELDAEEGSTLENGYSREALKEMIERRQRNDFVRLDPQRDVEQDVGVAIIGIESGHLEQAHAACTPPR